MSDLQCSLCVLVTSSDLTFVHDTHGDSNHENVELQQSKSHGGGGGGGGGEHHNAT